MNRNSFGMNRQNMVVQMNNFVDEPFSNNVEKVIEEDGEHDDPFAVSYPENEKQSPEDDEIFH